MKKAILLFMFLCVNLNFAQDTFVNKYTSYITNIDDKKSEWEEIDLTVVFNEKNTNNVVLYYPNKTKTLYKIGNVKTDKTSGGDEFQIIECIDDGGLKVSLQLFDGALRILFDGGYIEFHN
jgi:hypothetical protein